MLKPEQRHKIRHTFIFNSDAPLPKGRGRQKLRWRILAALLKAGEPLIFRG